ncbi:hypothetical protein LX36DRAFT_462522 [Colletotrichum falcatum]|nr:hypothetical protein LX36DRAFT_462522 [Colletotrichum falcatum]
MRVGTDRVPVEWWYQVIMAKDGKLPEQMECLGARRDGDKDGHGTAFRMMLTTVARLRMPAYRVCTYRHCTNMHQVGAYYSVLRTHAPDVACLPAYLPTLHTYCPHAYGAQKDCSVRAHHSTRTDTTHQARAKLWGCRQTTRARYGCDTPKGGTPYRPDGLDESG